MNRAFPCTSLLRLRFLMLFEMGCLVRRLFFNLRNNRMKRSHRFLDLKKTCPSQAFSRLQDVLYSLVKGLISHESFNSMV